MSAFGFRLKVLAFDRPPAPSRSLPRQPTRVRLPRPSCSECAGIGSERMQGARVNERRGVSGPACLKMCSTRPAEAPGRPYQTKIGRQNNHILRCPITETEKTVLIKTGFMSYKQAARFSYKIKSKYIKNKSSNTHTRSHSRPRTH